MNIKEKWVEKLREYFEGESPGMVVQTDVDVDLQAYVFRFHQGSRFSHLLRVSAQVIDDTQLPELIEKLGKQQWKRVLQTAGSSRVIFTSKGFEALA